MRNRCLLPRIRTKSGLPPRATAPYPLLLLRKPQPGRFISMAATTQSVLRKPTRPPFAEKISVFAEIHAHRTRPTQIPDRRRGPELARLKRSSPPHFIVSTNHQKGWAAGEFRHMFFAVLVRHARRSWRDPVLPPSRRPTPRPGCEMHAAGNAVSCVGQYAQLVWGTGVRTIHDHLLGAMVHGGWRPVHFIGRGVGRRGDSLRENLLRGERERWWTTFSFTTRRRFFLREFVHGNS